MAKRWTVVLVLETEDDVTAEAIRADLLERAVADQDAGGALTKLRRIGTIATYKGQAR